MCLIPFIQLFPTHPVESVMMSSFASEVQGGQIGVDLRVDLQVDQKAGILKSIINSNINQIDLPNERYSPKILMFNNFLGIFIYLISIYMNASNTVQ